jgi:class 3 adenylate cyclase/predicted ATPase
MICAQCKTENPDGLKFCNECGAAFKASCASCGFENAPTAKFCGNCGSPIAGSAAAAIKQPGTSAIRLAEAVDTATLDGERKTVTALFADIKGSTELMERLDPEEARAIIDPALKIMVDAVRRYEGYVVQSTGDGIFALFGAPVAHEDHPQRALYAALQILQELRNHAHGRGDQERPTLEARIGINTGEVVVRTVEIGGKVEYTPIGHTANLASRLQTAAPAGSIAVSEHTRKLVEGYFELRSLGPMTVKGVTESLKIFEVTGLGPLRTHFELSARRGLTRFIGREREMQQINHALESAMDGHGQLVAIVADAGTGKSRLFHEFKVTLSAEYKLLEAYSVSHGMASAWLPTLELLRSYFALQDADNAAQRRDKINAALASLDPALSDVQPYLFGLLGIQESPDLLAQMAPQIRRQRTLEAIKRIIVRESLEQPTVIIFEDLHWIDSESQALLDLLADSIAGARLLLLVNYRPEYRHEWSGRSHYLQLRLDPLGAENARTMLAALLGEGAELDGLRRLIAERTAGNPFFIEEMVQALFEQGILARNGGVELVRPLAEAHLPVTVQGVLAARIDRLPPDGKELLQALAVIGNEFPLALARRVTQLSEEALQHGMANLRLSEFIYERPLSADIEYSFKHALTHEVAYNSLLVQRRKILHERAGQSLESLFTEQLDDHLVELARHYRHSDNVSKAIEYLGRAGQQGIQRSANTDAVANLTAAIGLLRKLPHSPENAQRELVLQLALAVGLAAIKGFSAPEVERTVIRARELGEQLGDVPELFRALHGLWAVLFIRAEFREAYGLAEQLMARAQSKNDSTLLVSAHFALGDTSFNMGKLLLAREHLEAVISLYDSERHSAFALQTFVDVKVNALGYVAMTLWTLGYPDQARVRAHEAVEFAQAVRHPHSLAGAENMLGIVEGWLRENSAVQVTAERLIPLCTEHGLRLWLTASMVQRGWAIAEQGDDEQGISLMQEGLSLYRATGAEIGLPYHLCGLAEAYIRAARYGEGAIVLEEALVAADKSDERQYEAEIYRMRGELLLKRNPSNPIEALTSFQRAIAISQNQTAKSLELRATMSLARLLAKQGRRDKARAILADIYNWFTEGFDTADLKEAKALLDELSR